MDNSNTKNPELLRNFWLELSLSRLIIMPLIIAALFYIVFLFNKNDSDCSQTISNFAIIGFGLLVLFWGSKVASESIVDELNSHTWDAQRLTLISPWQMTLGKLLGSTIYQWYGGLICLLVYLGAGLNMGKFGFSLKIAIMYVLAAIFVHAMAINISLLGIKKNRFKAKINSTGFFLFSLLLGIGISAYIIPIATQSTIKIDWFFLSVELSDFGFFSILFFTCWATIGLYRSMRSEFQFQNGAKTWLTFLFSLMLYLGGFAANIKDQLIIQIIAGLYVCLSICVYFTYILAVIESKYIVDFRKQIQLLKNSQLSGFLQNASLWFLSLCVAIIIVVSLIIIPFIAQENGNDGIVSSKVIIDKMLSAGFLLPLTLLFFMIRDIAMLLFLNFGKNPKRADLSFLLYLFLIYFVFPYIFYQINTEYILSFFWVSFEHTYLQPLFILLEALVAVWLVIIRFKERNKECK